MAPLYDDGFLNGPDDYDDGYIEDIDDYIDTASKEELIDYLHQGYHLYLGSDYITLAEICGERKKLTEDEIRNLPETDEGYAIWVYGYNEFIEIWL